MRSVALLVFSSLALAALLASAIPGFAQSTPPPTAYSSVLYVPVAVRGVNGDDSGIQVQNTSNSAATVTLEYYDQAGNVVTAEAPQVVPAGSSVTFYQPANAALPLGFDGSAVIRSTRPIEAIVNRVNYSGAVASSDSLTVPNTTAAQQFTVPLVHGGLNGYDTTLSVQNTGAAPATYRVSLVPNLGASGASTSTTLTIPSNAVRRVQVGIDVAVPADFIGTAFIDSANGTLVALGETRNANNGIWLRYGGVATGATTMNAPLLFKNYDSNHWMSGAQVANTSDASVVVNASVKNRDDNTSYSLPTITLGAHQGYFYDLQTDGSLPNNFVGSGTFVASGPVTVAVQETSAVNMTGMAYLGFSGGDAHVSVPLVFKNSNGWNTGVQVQNLGSVPTSVVISYYSSTGAILANDSDVVQPGNSVTFYQPSDANLPDGLVGSATLSSDGQPLVAIVNEVNYQRSGDAAMAYGAIAYNGN